MQEKRTCICLLFFTRKTFLLFFSVCELNRLELFTIYRVRGSGGSGRVQEGSGLSKRPEGSRRVQKFLDPSRGPGGSGRVQEGSGLSKRPEGSGRVQKFLDPLGVQEGPGGVRASGREASGGVQRGPEGSRIFKPPEGSGGVREGPGGSGGSGGSGRVQRGSSQGVQGSRGPEKGSRGPGLDPEVWGLWSKLRFCRDSPTEHGSIESKTM
jgi:hypothetical protein